MSRQIVAPGFVKADDTYTIDLTHAFRPGDYGAGLADLSARGVVEGRLHVLVAQTETTAVWERLAPSNIREDSP